MNEYKTKFLLMLSTLVKTMEASSKKTVNMPSYIKGLEPNIPLDAELAAGVCGAPACIVGEQAIQKNFEIFPTVITTISKGAIVSRDVTELAVYCTAIQSQLREACREALGSSDLAQSMISGSAYERCRAAVNAGLCKSSEIVYFTLLTEPNPKTKDVVKYIKHCISYVEGLE